MSLEGQIEDAVPAGPNSCFGIPAASLIDGNPIKDLLVVIDPVEGPPDTNNITARLKNEMILEDILDSSADSFQVWSNTCPQLFY